MCDEYVFFFNGSTDQLEMFKKGVGNLFYYIIT
jgi:hypothetical protein